MIMVLEGGYLLEAMAEAAAAVAALLLGESHTPLAWPARGRLDPLVQAYRRTQAPHWPVLGS